MYKDAKKDAKRMVAKARQERYQNMHDDMLTKGGSERCLSDRRTKRQGEQRCSGSENVIKDMKKSSDQTR